jgi:RND superfamily putative drug exporter
VPLLVAAVSVLGTFLLVAGLTEFTSVSQIVQFLIALVGLGVAIDYSLLVVTRWREERSNGKPNRAAVQSAMEHAGRAVVFSGLTVAIGLLALIVLPVPFLRSAGYGGVLVPLVSIAVAVTLLPALLDTVGPAMDRFRLRTDRTASRAWSAWARGVYRHRWAAAIAGTAILAALILPALSMQVGEPASTTLSTAGPAREALDTLTRGGVPSGVLTPIQVLTNAEGADRIAGRAADVTGVAAAITPNTGDSEFRQGGTALLTVLPETETSLPAGQHAVARLRTSLDGEPELRGITGPGPAMADFTHAVYGSFPLMLTLISLATFLLLARAFRSVLLAAKAVVFNLVSLAAAYGVLTWIWQQGHGSNAIWGIPATGAVTMWVPVMVFAFLFGLSMDYEVFILTRIRESYDRTGDTRVAVVEGIGRTGRLVTSAAAILMLSFLAMSTSAETDIKLLATGLGAGILIDALIVRCLMVPAMIALFGRWNWWMPTWLARPLRIPAHPGPRVEHTSAPISELFPGPAEADSARQGKEPVPSAR